MINISDGKFIKSIQFIDEIDFNKVSIQVILQDGFIFHEQILSIDISNWKNQNNQVKDKPTNEQNNSSTSDLASIKFSLVNSSLRK